MEKLAYNSQNNKRKNITINNNLKITQSNTLRQSLLDECKNWISEARSYNSQEVTVQGLSFDTWDNARNIGDASDIDILTGPRIP